MAVLSILGGIGASILGAVGSGLSAVGATTLGATVAGAGIAGTAGATTGLAAGIGALAVGGATYGLTALGQAMAQSGSSQAAITAEQRGEVLTKKANLALERGLMTEGGIEGSQLQEGSFKERRKVFGK